MMEPLPRRLTSEDRARAELARVNLVRFRRELGLSAAELADRAQMPLDTYRQLEKGTRRLTNVNILLVLSDATGHAVEDFFTPEPPPHDPGRLSLIGVRVLPGSEVDDDIWAAVVDAVKAAERRQRRRDQRKSTSS